MNKLIYCLLLQPAFSTGKIYIRNQKLPVCINCIHFIEYKNKYDNTLPSDPAFGRCRKFGRIDYITGLLIYDFADDCRDDDRKCGKNASEYVEKLNNVH